MGIVGMFRRPIWIRRWGADGRHDFQMRLNVQPLRADELQALPEGLRQTKRLKAWGPSHLTAADQSMQQRGDWMYYCGRWYECVSSIRWDHTPLGHYESEFCQVDGSIAASNLEPPTASPAPPPQEGGTAGDSS